MKNTEQLDPFETALLAELRREVAEHPAPAPAVRRPPRRRLKLVAAGAVATAAATVAAVGLTGGGPTASPAFAVDASSDGSVYLAIHRLDDAAGLEAALAAHGIDATVHFVPMPDGQVPPEPEIDGSWAHDKPGPGNPCGIDNGPGPAMLVPGDQARGFGKNRVELGTIPVDGGFVLEFPADSPLLDRKVILDVGSPGSFWITYPSSTPGEWCGFGQSPVFEAPTSGEGTYSF